MNKKAQGAFAAIFIVIVVIGVLIGLAGFDSVNEHSKGVKVRMGKIIGTMEPGIAWTGMFTNVYEYDLLTRRMDLSFEGDSFAPAKDKQAVYAKISINYRINPDSGVIVQLRERYGDDKTVAERMQLDKIVEEGFKQAVAKFTSDEIQEDRQAVKELAIEKINNNFPTKFFTLEMITISNLHFNKAYQDAIEKAKVAEKEALAAQKLQAIKEAEANAKVAEAEGDRKVKQQETDAIAYEKLTIAKAEAEALKLKKEQLNSLLVENNMIDMLATTWDGKLPVYSMGDSGNGIGLLMQMPSESKAAAMED